MRHPFRPCAARVGGVRLPHAFWRYKADGRVLTAVVPAVRRARLSVTAC
jgi:hypothetical protein